MKKDQYLIFLARTIPDLKWAFDTAVSQRLKPAATKANVNEFGWLLRMILWTRYSRASHCTACDRQYSNFFVVRLKDEISQEQY